MARMTILAAGAALLTISGAAFAQYNPVPSGDPQYAQCLAYTLDKYTEGGAASRVAGQTKAQAFCTCMWNETPDDFKGDLGKFADTTKGAATNKVCERHSGWES